MFPFEPGLVVREATVARAHSIGHARSVTDEAKKLLEEALKLPVRQRAGLVSSLIDSLEGTDHGTDPTHVGANAATSGG